MPYVKPPGLQKRRDFLRVQGRGRRFKGRCMALLVDRAETSQDRVGYTVSRKVGNAVVRNRVRRKLREVVRLHPEALVAGHDFVIIAFSTAATANYHALQDELLWLLKKANAWASSQPSSSD